MIRPGTVLMQEGTPRPPCFQLEGDPYPNGWMCVKHNLSSYEREQDLVAAGLDILLYGEFDQDDGVRI